MIKVHRFFLSIALILASQVALAEIPFCYPVTPKDLVVDQLHGTDVVDPYRWLENADDTKVMEWTADQNQLTNCYLDSLLEESWVLKRLEGLARCEHYTFQDVAVGERRFVWWQKVGEEQRVLYWQEEPTAPLVTLLNPNAWEGNKKLDFAIPSADGHYVAYGVSTAGDECCEIKIIHVDDGQVLPDNFRGRRQGWFGGAVSWLPDNSGLYYTALPEIGEVANHEAEYWTAVYLHHLGTTKEEDKTVFAHPTVRECIHLAQVSQDGQWVVFQRSLGLRDELYLQRLDDPTSNLVPLAVGFSASYSVSFAGSDIVLVTDLHAANREAYLVDPNHPERDNWKLLLPADSDPLLNVQGIGGRFYAQYLHNAHTIVHVFDADGQWQHVIPLESMGTAYVSGLWHKPDVWVDFASFAHPRSRYSYDCCDKTLTLQDFSNAFVSVPRFHVEQQWYPSKDGTLISMFLIYDQAVSEGQTRPALLTGYGGFGIPVTPDFSSFYVPFLEAGGLVAIPNLRGGGEYGETWHRQGMLDKKQNVFDDFIAAAEWLIDKGYTTPDTLAIRGRSNGGLLVGAAMTQRPELFRAVLCEVPLLDMVRYHKFGFSNLWAGEYGNADNKEQFRYLLRYSPYHCVVDDIRYPAILVRGAENDSRTDALHARKMIAKLQAADPHGYAKLLLIEKNSGHLGGNTVAEQVRQRAEALVFVMDQLGMLCHD